MGNEDDKTKEGIPLDEVDKTTEKTPLKDGEGKDGENAKLTESGEKAPNGKDAEAGEDGHIPGLVARWKANLILGIIITVGLVCLIAVLLIIMLSGGEDTGEDRMPRFLAIYPKPNGPQNMIRFRRGHGSEGAIWPSLTEQLNEVWSNYNPEINRRTKNVTDCSATIPVPDGYSCFFDIELLKGSGCTPDDNFGYAAGTPCVFLQFANVTNWTPEPYSTKDLSDLTNLPPEMKDNYPGSGAYLTCKGNTPVDQESIGIVSYAPVQGFLAPFFPYTGQPSYMSPLVAIRFQKPTTGIVIGVTCRLWAKNLETHPTHSPLLHFNLLVE